MGTPAKRMSVGKFKGHMIADIPTGYLAWFANNPATFGAQRGKIHIRAGIILELEKRGVPVSDNKHTQRARNIIGKEPTS